jgi:hypothetical protein
LKLGSLKPVTQTTGPTQWIESDELRGALGKLLVRMFREPGARLLDDLESQVIAEAFKFAGENQVRTAAFAASACEVGIDSPAVNIWNGRSDGLQARRPSRPGPAAALVMLRFELRSDLTRLVIRAVNVHIEIAAGEARKLLVREL